MHRAAPTSSSMVSSSEKHSNPPPPPSGHFRRACSLLVAGLLAFSAWRFYRPLDIASPAGLSPATVSTSTFTEETLLSHPASEALACFQVAEPVVVPDESVQGRCSALLMSHVFAWSYGKPFVGYYTPPSCQFNRVVINLTVISEGRQFDRLALLFFNDTEIWRSSTAEPVKHPGIQWTVIKDMTHLSHLWKESQKIIFDLGNLVDDKYTGTFNTTLTASFYFDPTVAQGTTSAPADLIIPVSGAKGAADRASHFVLPEDRALRNILLPRNINRAVFSVSANAQAQEEFWWSNVLESDRATFGKTFGDYPGLSPFREVQLLIDGTIAGVAWPFPVIFTGGVTPSLHRPIVGLQAFDLREHELDITPWLPLLCDGIPHEFQIRVMGLQDNGLDRGVLSDRILDSWYVSGKIFLWLDDDDNSVTTGTMLSRLPSTEPHIRLSRGVSRNETGFNQSLSFEVSVQRSLAVATHVRSQKRHSHVVWSQDLEYANAALVGDYGFTQVNDFQIRGIDAIRGTGDNDDLFYERAYSYPLWCNQSISLNDQGDMLIRSRLIEGLHLKTRGNSVFPTGLEGYDDDDDDDDDAAVDDRGAQRQPLAQQHEGYHDQTNQGHEIPGGAHLTTVREGSGQFFASADRKFSSGSGSTQQLFYFGRLMAGQSTDIHRAVDNSRELYFRNVTAVNGSVVADTERCAAAAAGMAIIAASREAAVKVVEKDEAQRQDGLREGSAESDEDAEEKVYSEDDAVTGEVKIPGSKATAGEFAEPFAVRRLLAAASQPLEASIDFDGQGIEGEDGTGSERVIVMQDEQQRRPQPLPLPANTQQNRLLGDW